MGKTVAVCQVGGEFVTNNDGSMSYTGGEAYAVPIVPNMKFDEFKLAIAEMCNHDAITLSIKYLLPSNRRTPITISNDKHMQCMIDFHEDSATIDVFVLDGETNAQNTDKTDNNRANRPTSRTSRPTSRIAKRAAATDSITQTPTVNNVRKGRRATVTDPVASNAAMAAPSSGDSIARRISSRITASDTTVTEPTTPIATIAAVGNDKRPAQYSSPGNTIFDVGQEFNSVCDFRDALRAYAIVKGFAYRTIRSGNARVTSICRVEGCSWRVHASRLRTTQRFKIKTMNNVHTCGVGVGKDGHPNATKFWVASIIKDKLRNKPQYKPKEIVNDIYREYGVNLTYRKAWGGKLVAQEQLQDSQSYSQLPWFCNRIKETNPGSLVTLTTTSKSRFHRLFISFHASRHGFENGCRPLILLDGTSLSEKCQGTLLAAVSVDGDDAVFPIAFAIVDFESYDNWIWFLTELKLAVSTNQTITFVSDRRNRLEEAVPQVFEGSYHAYSLHHLTEDFKLVLKGPSQPVKDALADDIKRAAYSCSITDFNACIDNIRNFSHDVASWVLLSKPEHWSNAFFKGSRYDHLSSNIAELFYGWISEECELSIIQIIDMIRCKMMEMIYARREASSAWLTILTPSMEQRLDLEIHNSHPLSVLFLSGSMFEVRDDSVNVVDIETRDCTCRRWKMTGLPCVHAAAVFDRTGRNTYDYCSRYFTVDCYRSTYSESIHPIPDIGNPLSEVSNTKLIVRPPHSHRPPGRPKLKLTELLDPSKRPGRFRQRCRRGAGSGHNKKICKEVELGNH